jgi:hypothetical protein
MDNAIYRAPAWNCVGVVPPDLSTHIFSNVSKEGEDHGVEEVESNAAAFPDAL